LDDLHAYVDVRCLFVSHVSTISGNEIGGVGATALADALRSNNTITDLNMSCTTALIASKQPADLFLVWSCIDNRIGTEGATAMADMLRVNRSLLKLDFSCTRTPCDPLCCIGEGL
jgi:hypothetical protein